MEVKNKKNKTQMKLQEMIMMVLKKSQMKTLIMVAKNKKNKIQTKLQEMIMMVLKKIVVKNQTKKVTMKKIMAMMTLIFLNMILTTINQ